MYHILEEINWALKLQCGTCRPVHISSLKRLTIHHNNNNSSKVNEGSDKLAELEIQNVRAFTTNH